MSHDAKALWAMRVLDRKHARLRHERGSTYTDGPHVVCLSDRSFTVIWWGSISCKLATYPTEDAARIAAAEALVIEDPSLDPRLELARDALWATHVLDAEAQSRGGGAVPEQPKWGSESWWIKIDESMRDFRTADEARVALAKALVAEDPSLDPNP